jgi:lambda repressor-like predicted transcriptional regulator
LELDRPPRHPAPAQSSAVGFPQATLTAKAQATASTKKADELIEWERLRQQIRAVRQARGITLRILAGELGLKASTVETALQTRRPASLRLQQHLTDWLAASEVAAMPAEPFRPEGRGLGDARSASVDGHNCQSMPSLRS